MSDTDAFIPVLATSGLGLNDCLLGQDWAPADKRYPEYPEILCILVRFVRKTNSDGAGYAKATNTASLTSHRQMRLFIAAVTRVERESIRSICSEDRVGNAANHWRRTMTSAPRATATKQIPGRH